MNHTITKIRTKKLIFNWGNNSICDSKIDNPTCIKFNRILNEIDRISTEERPIKIKINLNENYLRDESIFELLEFLKNNSKITKYLALINLTNNRLTQDCFPAIEEMLSLCPNLKINITSNNILKGGFKQSSLSENNRVILL